MIGRALVFLALLPLSALAQIQLVQFDGVNENPVGTTYSVGTAAPGDTLPTRFRVRNTGTALATLQTLSLAGTGFQITSAPALPYIIAPGSEAEFDVAFSPQLTGSYSAFLSVNTITVTLKGTSAPDASLMLAGSAAPLMTASVVNFGSVAEGSTQLQAFMLFNAGSGSVTVNTLTVSGVGFHGPIGLAAPVQLAAGQTATFQVAFEPQSATPAQGILTLDQRAFNLQGQGIAPQPSGASIAFASMLFGSAQQNSVSIALASPSLANVTDWTLQLSFQPASGLPDDPAILFLSGMPRLAPVTFSVGSATATIGGEPSITFQTGTTAGTILFTLQRGDKTIVQQASVPIAPGPISFDTAASVRKFNELDVSVAGFDNTYSASELAFTFYDTKGNTVPPGAISVNASSDFQQYFAATQQGGMFALLAKFPVTGDTTQILSVDIQATNSAGVTTASKVPIGN